MGPGQEDGLDVGALLLKRFVLFGLDGQLGPQVLHVDMDFIELGAQRLDLLQLSFTLDFVQRLLPELNPQTACRLTFHSLISHFTIFSLMRVDTF